jgi:hypothetical protein
MGRAIDLFVTYRFIKLLVTPFEKTDAYKLGIIDENGNRIMPPPKGGVRQTKPASLGTTEEKNAYTILHKLVFNIKKIFAKVPGLRTKLGTYAAALFLLKDTFKESVDTVLGVDIFPVIHINSQEKIYVSLEDIK